MPLPNNMTDFTALLSQLGHKRVAQSVMALLLIYIAFVFSIITWSVVPTAQSNQGGNQTHNTQGHNSKSEKKSVDVTKIQSLNLFGLYNQSTTQEVEVSVADVPQTRLNLVLSGLVASDNQSVSAAIIEYQGKQETYGVGDVIKGTRASLEDVLMDRVLIKQSGKLETLMLDGYDHSQPAQNVASESAARKAKKAASPKATTGTVDHRDNQELSNTAKNLRKEFSSDPAKIGDYLRISPKRKDGGIVGYSLRPGKKPQFFKLAGLKSGDVAVQMNGYDLTETAQAIQAMAEMKQASNIALLVDRQGSLTEILISL